MKKLSLFLIVLLLPEIVNAQNTKKNFSSQILKNWAASQAGVFLGWGLTSITFRLSEVVFDIQYKNNDSQNNIYMGFAIPMGLFFQNYLLKKQAKQSNSTFFKNLLFSSTPIIFYEVFAKPKLFRNNHFLKNYEKDVGLILISLFISPIFSTVGNEIFNPKSFIRSENISFQIYPRLVAERNSVLINVHLKL